MQVSFQRFGGVSPILMNRLPPFVKELTADEAVEARNLLPPAFYDLASSGSPTRAVDAFRYDIAVDDGGQSHHVELAEGDVPTWLRPFLNWLLQKASGSSR